MKTYFALILILSIHTFAQIAYREASLPVQVLRSSGTLTTITILIKFQGEAEFSSTRSSIDQLFNSTTSQSLKHYYNEVSYGKLSINTFLYPQCAPTTNLSYAFPRPRGYFQPYSTGNTIGYANTRDARLREHEILDSAIIAIRAQVADSLDLDFNSDGYVDNVMFIFKGSSGAWGDVGLWPHSGVLDSYTALLKNKRVYHYSIHLETMISASTFCHETFHVLGAPDLYRYSVAGTPVGNWDIMASGSAHMGAYMKYKYTNKKWIVNIPEITKSGTYTLSPLTSDTNNCYRINSPYTKDEFFILEYRRQSGLYETGLPGSGLLIYRINTKADNGNGGGPPDEIYIYRRGGTPTTGGTISQAFFSAASGRTAFNDLSSDPKCFLNNGSAGGIDIRNIGTAGNTISFQVRIINCTIVQPYNNATYKQGDTVSIITSATDSADIAKVEFYIDSNLSQTVTSFPYQYKWLTQGASLGRHLVRAKAFGTNNVYKWDSIYVNITDGSPYVEIVNPKNGTIMGDNDSLIINVNAYTPAGTITSVRFLLDGQTVSTQTSPPYRYQLNASPLTYGSHSIEVSAVNSFSQQGGTGISIYKYQYLIREGFEAQWPPTGWNVNSMEYGWYQSDKGMYAGSKCAATRNYHARGEAILETPAIAGLPRMKLDFYWLDRSLDITSPIAGFDTTYCEISANGGAWTKLKILSSADVDPAYHQESIDLSVYEGKTIKIRWRDVSDESLDAAGSALDNVELYALPKPNGSEKNDNADAPYQLSLEQNYPNPFNPVTNITYSLPSPGTVELSLYSVLGERVRSEINEIQSAGIHHHQIKADALSSGIYLCVLRFQMMNLQNLTAVRKITLLK